MTFPQKCKYIREKLFLSQQAFAKEINVAFATVNRWEKGICAPNYKAKKAFHEFCKKNNIDLEDK